LLLGEVAKRLHAASAEVLGPITDATRAEFTEAITLRPGTGNEQLPIHPDVIRRLDISFRTPESRYAWMGNEWTFEEYMMRYISYDTNW
jgi:hypothetical protein